MSFRTHKPKPMPYLSAGFTGTQDGMAPRQLQRCGDVLRTLFATNYALDEFHHGDCIESDEAAHNIVSFWRVQIHIHPPEDSSKRAFCKAMNVYMYPPKPYLDRNRDIVAASHVLVATPKGAEKRRSGTWYTVRQARLRELYTIIIWPDGQLTEEHRK